MRNIGLILRREYLERVRTKSFLISTILLPLFMFGMIFLPSKLAMMKTEGTKHIAIISNNAEIAQSVASQLTDGTRFGTKYSVDVDQRHERRRACQAAYRGQQRADSTASYGSPTMQLPRAM